MSKPQPASTQPSLFVSHGPPTMVIDDLTANARLAEIGRQWPRPRAVLAISAHWMAPRPTVTAAPWPATLHDYAGFPDALYRLNYPAPGAPELAAEVGERLTQAGWDAALDPERGRDHGAWQTAMLIWPEAVVPVIQLSLLEDLDPRRHLELGRALAPLREAGVLILASGTAVHNLSQWRVNRETTPDWAKAFDDWLAATLADGDPEALIAFRRHAPGADRAHPSDEHLTPLFVALGAAGANAKGRPLHRGFEYGSLSMASYAFG